MSRLRAVLLTAAAGLGLGACTMYDDYGYGYGGLSVGYGSGYCDPYWDDCYGGYGYGAQDSWYGWYGDYYYPGYGIYIYDSYRRPYRWNDHHRRYWEHRRQRWGDRNWNDRRWERWDYWDRSDRYDRRYDRDRDGHRGDWRRDRDRGDWRGRRGDRSERRDWDRDNRAVEPRDTAPPVMVAPRPSRDDGPSPRRNPRVRED